MTDENIVEVDDTNWEKIVEKGEKPIIVMFYSPACPHCQEMAPHFTSYASEFKDKVIFAKLNIVNNITTASRYGVMGTPTFKLFCNGKPVQELVGAMYPALLKKAIEDTFEHGSKCVKDTTWFDPGITGYA
jgi:thioredoxin-like negative regulator of GroEL